MPEQKSSRRLLILDAMSYIKHAASVLQCDRHSIPTLNKSAVDYRSTPLRKLSGLLTVAERLA